MVIMLGIVAAGLFAARRWGEHPPVGVRLFFVVLSIAFVQESVVMYLTAGEGFGSRLLLTVLGGCLLFASITDHKTCQVYCFTWWPVYIAVLPSLWRMGGDAFIPLGIFLFLQFRVFGRMYGRADCYAFGVCASVLTTRGEGLMGFLMHMLLAWLLLASMQAVRGNIGRRGNLKKPVPFLPYITVAFWLVLLFKKVSL